MRGDPKYLFVVSTALLALVFISLAGFDLGCGTSSSTSGEQSNPTPSPTATSAAMLSYATDIQPIWNTNCTSSNCHFGGGQGGLVLTSGVSYNELTQLGGSQNGPVVTANDPDSSVLVKKLGSSPPFGSRMPVGGVLSSSDIQKIRGWISQGAQNN